MKVTELNFMAGKIPSIQTVKAPPVELERGTRTPQTGKTFSEVLSGQAREGLKFSAHAVQRLNDRGMDIQPEEMQRLETGFRQASEKGARNSLILVDDHAYVVSIRNKTVVTTIPTGDRNIFTNVDSVAIV